MGTKEFRSLEERRAYYRLLRYLVGKELSVTYKEDQARPLPPRLNLTRRSNVEWHSPFNFITSRQSATLAFKDVPFFVPVFRIGFDQLDSRQCSALWAYRAARSRRRYRWGQCIQVISHTTQLARAA